MTNKLTHRTIIIYCFFLAILGPVLEDAAKELFQSKFLESLFGVVDEIFVLGILGYTVFSKKLTFGKSEFFFTLFVLCGLCGGTISHVPLKVQALGCFNTCKAIIIFLCFRKINFEKNDILLFIKLCCSLFWLLLIPLILDALFPNFRSIIGYNRVSQVRMGLRGVSGLIRETHLTIFACFIYFAYAFYLKKPKFYKYAACFMVIAPLKVKDFFGFILPLIFTTAKKINPLKIIIFIFGSYLCFNIYALAMPTHYATYFGEESLMERQARPVLYKTSALIAKDEFPFGVGFGRFGSPTSQQIESPVYAKYKIDQIYGLNYIHNSRFMSDTFWPMILGETGITGLVFYVLIVLSTFKGFLLNFFKNTDNLNFLLPSVIFLFCLVSSAAKPVFSGPPNSFFVWGLAGLFYNICFKKRQTW